MKPMFCSVCGSPMCRAHGRGLNDWTYSCEHCKTMVRIWLWESVGERYDVEMMIGKKVRDMWMVEWYE